MPKKKSNAVSSQQVDQLVSAMRSLMSKSVPAQPKTTKKKKKKSAKKSSTASDGRIVLSRKELLATVSLDANSSSSVANTPLSPSSLPFLKGLSKNFELFRWDRVSLFYKPAVGSTYGGLVTIGVDWDGANVPTTRAGVSALSPNRTVPAWQDSESTPMSLPLERLRSRPWYVPQSSASDTTDKYPATIVYALDGTSAKNKQTVGEIWISYQCTMQGTNVP